MIGAVADFLLRQCGFASNSYRTDAVAVYALNGDSAAQQICKKLHKLYQGKKEILFQELSGGLHTIRSKRLADVKNHIILVPQQMGRITNVVDYLPLFDGQKLIIIQTWNQVSKKDHKRKPDQLEALSDRISSLERQMFDAITEGNHAPTPALVQKYKSIVSDVFLYHHGFKSKDSKKRFLRFIDLLPPVEGFVKAEKNKKEQIETCVSEKKRKTE